jgi:Arf/Sar family protein
MGGVIARLRALFFSRRLEVVLVGLEGSGKTTFCNYLALGKAVEEPPTVVRG